MRHSMLALFTVAITLGTIRDLSAADRYALLVGVKKYGSGSGLRSLEYTESDVEELGKILLAAGFKQNNITSWLHRDSRQRRGDTMRVATQLPDLVTSRLCVVNCFEAPNVSE